MKSNKGKSKNETYTERISGIEVVRIKRGLSKERTYEIWEEEVKKGKVVCLTDALINLGL